MYNKRQKVNIDDTRFIFDTNFSGDPTRDRFGSDKRKVNVVIPTEAQAQELINMGVNVRMTKPNAERIYDEPFVPTYFVTVVINLKSNWPPHVYWITTNGKRILCNEDTIGQLDFIRIKNVCVQATLFEQKRDPDKYSLYVDVMYVEQDVDADPYADRYARYASTETSNNVQPDGPADLPF